MRLVAVAVAVATASLAPSFAVARPFTAGVRAGVHHDQADDDREGNRALGLFGRVGLSPRLSTQLEVHKIAGDAHAADAVTTRTGTLLLVMDLVDVRRGSRLIPTLSFGMGIDRASTGWQDAEGTHFEGGFGLEYRAAEGVTLGVDLRFGGRSVEEAESYDDTLGDDGFCVIPEGCSYPPTSSDLLREGEYRALAVTLGVAF